MWNQVPKAYLRELECIACVWGSWNLFSILHCPLSTKLGEAPKQHWMQLTNKKQKEKWKRNVWVQYMISFPSWMWLRSRVLLCMLEAWSSISVTKIIRVESVQYSLKKFHLVIVHNFLMCYWSCDCWGFLMCIGVWLSILIYVSSCDSS